MANTKKLNVKPRNKKGSESGANKKGSPGGRKKGGNGGGDLPHNKKDAPCISLAKDESDYS